MAKVTLVLITLLSAVTSHTPIIFWHGFANAYTVTSINEIKVNLQSIFPGMYIKLLQIGNNVLYDFINSISMHPDQQIELACQSVQSDPLLAQGYIGIGFSQGGLLLRGLVQRCPQPRMKKLITFGTAHQGVYGLPNCNRYHLCNMIRKFYNKLAYTRFLQNYFVQATYWHDPLDMKQYKQANTFLADINNENHINKTYIHNLNKLEKFVMVKYTKETFVVPSESEWFGFYKNNEANLTEALQHTQFYIKDQLGLRKMNKEGKLDFLSVPWEHVEFHWDWFRDNIITRYLT